MTNMHCDITKQAPIQNIFQCLHWTQPLATSVFSNQEGRGSKREVVEPTLQRTLSIFLDLINSRRSQITRWRHSHFHHHCPTGLLSNLDSVACKMLQNYSEQFFSWFWWTFFFRRALSWHSAEATMRIFLFATWITTVTCLYWSRFETELNPAML